MNKVFKNYKVCDIIESIIEAESSKYKNLKGSVDELLNLYRKDILYSFSEFNAVKVRDKYLKKVIDKKSHEQYSLNLSTHLKNIIHAHYKETIRDYKKQLMSQNASLLSVIESDFDKEKYQFNNRIVKKIKMWINGYENRIIVVYGDDDKITSGSNSNRTKHILLNIKKVAKLSDYEKSLKEAKKIPKFHLGQEVQTPYGKGIIVKMEMPWNGLYISPENSDVVVWYSTESAVNVGGSNGKFVNVSYKLTELLPL